MSSEDANWFSRVFERLSGTREKPLASKESSHNNSDVSSSKHSEKELEPESTQDYHCGFSAVTNGTQYVQEGESFSVTAKRSQLPPRWLGKPVTICAIKVERDNSQTTNYRAIKNPSAILQGKRRRYWDKDKLTLTFDNLRISMRGEFYIEATFWETFWESGGFVIGPERITIGRIEVM
ncbi:hypothetical protein F5Y11DRAFT_318830 [Daldinia sp. FL1419]|nr:hypothetical protein F5Y11DRAFT_318830 [Daldinia sp. FL1419]